MREEGGVMTCALPVPNSRSGDPGPSHSEIALFPHFRGTSGGAVGVNTGLPLPDIRLERARRRAL